MRELLSDIAIHRGLATLPGWSRKGDMITKTFQFKTFPAAISFINRVALRQGCTGISEDSFVRLIGGLDF